MPRNPLRGDPMPPLSRSWQHRTGRPPALHDPVRARAAKDCRRPPAAHWRGSAATSAAKKRRAVVAHAYDQCVMAAESLLTILILYGRSAYGGFGANETPGTRKRTAIADGPAALFKTDRSSRSAGPQQMTKAPRCRLKRGVRGCEPEPRTPRLLSFGTELPSALPCPAGVGRVCTDHGEGGHLRPAVTATVIGLVAPKQTCGHHSSDVCCRG